MFGVFHADVLQEFFGADARPLRKKPLKMEGTEVDFLRHRVEVGLFAEMRADVADGFGDTFVLIGVAMLHIGELWGKIKCMRRPGKPETCCFSIFPVAKF